MKKLFIASIAVSLIGLASQASADPMYPTTTTGVVGGIDQMIAAGPSGSAHDDAAFINEVLGLSLTNEDIDNFKIESLDWFSVSDGAPNEYALNLHEDGGWFLVKTGPKPGGYNNFLFENGPSTSWATVVLGHTYEDVQAYSNEDTVFSSAGATTDIVFNLRDIQAISHITPAGGTPGAPVPEPATMLLLGAGMAGLAAVRRKK